MSSCSNEVALAKQHTAQRLQRLRRLDTRTVVKPKWRLIWLLGLLMLWLVCTGATPFHPLAYRLEHYPYWVTKPPVETAKGDLTYPDWFEGTWRVTTTLMDLTAPLAPDVVTPGFDSNRDYLNQPITFRARFLQKTSTSYGLSRWVKEAQALFSLSSAQPAVVADRAFNGLNLVRAYLNQSSSGMGDRLVVAVTVAPDDPNRQITRMEGDRQLVSTVTGRLTESITPHRFITTEVFQQVFRGIPQPYLNEVETTTDYRYTSNADAPITADQITAIYLSPRDADYFKAGDRPVALYRYRLEFYPESPLGEKLSH